MKTRIVVYTAVTRNYDLLRTPTRLEDDIDYIAFVDDPTIKNTSLWKLHGLEQQNLDPIRRSRFPKILPHLFFPNYDVSIYIDGNIDIIGDINKLLDIFTFENMLCFKHFLRDCIYDEAYECIRQNTGDPNVIKCQVDRYRSNGYPPHAGLIEANVIIRRHHSPIVVQTMECWWREFLSGGKRDQLSLNYCAWKHGLQIDLMGNDNARDQSNFFRYREKHAWKMRPLYRAKSRLNSLLPEKVRGYLRKYRRFL